jgi:hypothetical protein
MKVMDTLKHAIFGIPATGENIIDRQPGFRTYYPDSQVEFNTWSYILKVGSRVKKNDQVNPWYKNRK